MGQIAYRADTGTMVEAFSLSDGEWGEICSTSSNTLVMPYTDWPAVPKTSIKGLRFFAHHPGYPNKLPAYTSYAHIRLQIDIVKAARKLGFTANLEVRGPDASSPEWIADVLVISNTGKKVAFEVQLSSQHLDNFLHRTGRYQKSNIDVCWILSEKPVADRLCKALCHKNIQYYKKTGYFLADDERLLTFGLDISNKNKYSSPLPFLRFTRGIQRLKRLSLEDAIYGVMNNYPKWEEPYWKWVDPSEGLKIHP